MATGVRTAEGNLEGVLRRQIRGLERRVADLEARLAAIEVGGKRHRREPEAA